MCMWVLSDTILTVNFYIMSIIKLLHMEQHLSHEITLVGEKFEIKKKTYCGYGINACTLIYRLVSEDMT